MILNKWLDETYTTPLRVLHPQLDKARLRGLAIMGTFVAREVGNIIQGEALPAHSLCGIIEIGKLRSKF